MTTSDTTKKHANQPVDDYYLGLLFASAAIRLSLFGILASLVAILISFGGNHAALVPAIIVLISSLSGILLFFKIDIRKET